MSAQRTLDCSKVQILDGIIPDPIWKGLLASVPSLRWSYGWRASGETLRYWHCELSGGAKENLEDTSDFVRKHCPPVYVAYFEWLKSRLPGERHRLLRFYLNGHTYGTDGSPHTDSERDDEVTFVAYLNPEWTPAYGGETVVFNAAGDIEIAALPKANRILAFPAKMMHAPRPLSKIYGGLRIVLVTKFAFDG